jgi:hypothetical protein
VIADRRAAAPDRPVDNTAPVGSFRRERLSFLAEFAQWDFVSFCH